MYSKARKQNFLVFDPKPVLNLTNTDLLRYQCFTYDGK